MRPDPNPIGEKPTVRDPAGRFAAGTVGGPGRKPGKQYDVLAAAQRVAADRGIDLELAIGQVVHAMIDAARNGDVGAARVVLDRLAGPVRQELDVTDRYGAGLPTAGPVPSGDELAAVAGDVLERWRDRGGTDV